MSDPGPLLLLFTFVLLLLILSDSLYRNSLFNLSVSVIPSLQRIDIPHFKTLMQLISTGGLGATGGIGALYSLLLSPRIYGGIYIFTVSITLYLCLFLKNLYQNSRPFWVEGEIAAWGFEIGFGNPSGHAMLAAILIPCTWWIVIISHASRAQRDREQYIYNILFMCLKWVGGGMALALIPLIMFSRMYLGAHSLDQVIFGALLGIYIFISFFGFLRNILTSHIAQLFGEGEDIDMSYDIPQDIPLHGTTLPMFDTQRENRHYIYNIPHIDHIDHINIDPERIMNNEIYIGYKVRNSSESYKQLFIGVAMNICLIIIGIYSYLLEYPSGQIPPLELINIEKWRPEITSPYAALNDGFLNMATIGILLGFYLGVVLGHKWFAVDEGRWTQIGLWWQFLLRLLLVLFLGVFPGGILAYVFWGSHSLLLLFFFGRLLPTFSAGFAIFALAPYLSDKFGILPGGGYIDIL